MTENQKVTFYRKSRRYRSAPALPCFSWPLEEETISSVLSGAIGPVVISERDNPSWSRNIEAGQDATTPRIVELTTLDFTPGRLFQKRWCGGSYQRFAYQDITGELSQHTAVLDRPSSPPSVIDSKANAQALQNYISDARRQQGAFKGSTFMAELRDAIRGIRNPAKALRQGIDEYARAARRNARKANGGRRVPNTREGWRDFERSNPKRANGVARALSGSWLEHSFGWVPLANDISNAFDAASQLHQRPARARIRGQGMNESDPTTTFTERVFGGTTLRFEVNTKNTCGVRYYGSVKLEVDQPHNRVLEEFGFTVKDFLPAVWEAIPYSFLVDYFSNIGEVVSALSFPRSDVRWTARTFRWARVKQSLHSSYRNTGSVFPTNGSYVVVLHKPSLVTWTRKRIERDSYYGSFFPGIRFEIPGSKNWRKWLNIYALAAQRAL